MSEAPDKIDLTDSGDLDDVVVNDVKMFRMERINRYTFWLRCYCEGKPDVVFQLYSDNLETEIHGNHSYEERK